MRDFALAEHGASDGLRGSIETLSRMSPLGRERRPYISA
ncbi:hypothetical protein Z949_634 [Sulfitobacter guttiformis KCTC 32187]|nr:hypothetical protein Z949_634 [Sulfitobacter guttiformis KCTC 32187]